MMFLRMDLDFHIYLVHQKVHPAFFPTLVEQIAWETLKISLPEDWS